ncbi:oxidoreductase, short chain dehydrogenase/reductase family protein [Cooperia oncophora]
MNANDISVTVSAPASPLAASPERVRKQFSEVDLTGRTVLITGTTAGIGMETARTLALKGAHVIMANRNIVLAEALKNRDTCREAGRESRFDHSVQAAAQEYKEQHWPLHALILNAGVFMPAQKTKTTIDGLETSFGVNHVAHQYLVRELLPLLRQCKARVVVVSSHSHNHTGLKPEMSVDEKLAKLCPTESNDFGYKLYAYSKLCNVLMAMKLHRDEHKNGISVYVLHPGTNIATDISRSWGMVGTLWKAVTKPFVKSLEQGAATTVYCAASPEVRDVSGKYWESCWDDEKNLCVELARDEHLQNALWERTDKILDKFEASRQPIKIVGDS